MTEFEFAELSAGYALGALSPEDELAYHEALAEHPEWARLAASDASVVAELADGVAEVAPPIALRSRLLAQIARTDAAPAASVTAGDAPSGDALDVAAPGVDAPGDTVPADARALDLVSGDDDTDDDVRVPASALPTGSPATEQFQAIQRKSWTRSLFALTASIALLVGIGWGVGAITETLRAPTAASVLAMIEQSDGHQSSAAEIPGGGEATLHWSPDVEGVVLVADGLPAVADDEAYEAWFVRGELPVSAGVFEATDGSASMLLDGEMHEDDVIALTVEPADGSPSGQPTSDPLFAIPTA